MPSEPNTKQAESPKLSAVEQKIHDAFMSLPQLSEEQVQANREYNRSLPRATTEELAEMDRQMLENLRWHSLND